MTRILAWNLERKKVESSRGIAGLQYLFEQQPDIIAASETRTSFPTKNGYAIWARPPNGTFDSEERKILLWSKSPWREVDDLGLEELPTGRFISGVTNTEQGPARIVGICIPYHMADVNYGTQDCKPWQQHKKYLELLPAILARYTNPVVVAGDFNQRIPLAKYGNKNAAQILANCFKNMNIVTSGIPNGTTQQGLNHIALDHQLSSTRVWGWPNIVDDIRITDHDGAGCDF